MARCRRCRWRIWCPPDHFYRHLERTLDLAFVRDLVRETYAGIGRPSIDPVVFFKLQLILFFEGLRSERQLMRVVADRLSLRWYLGLRPDRAAARPLQPDPHPRAVRVGRCSAASSRRSSSSASRRDWSGARNSTSTRPMSRPMPRSTRSGHDLPSRRTSPGSSPERRRRQRQTAIDDEGGDAAAEPGSRPRRRCPAR